MEDQQESLRDYLRPITQFGRNIWGDVEEMYEGTKALGPLGKMLWDLTAQGETPEERVSQEEARAQMVKALYKELPIELAKDMAKLVDPSEWYEHPLHTAGRAAIVGGVATSIPKVGPKIAPTLGRLARGGAKVAVRNLEKAKIVHRLPGKADIFGLKSWSELGGFSPDDVVKHFSDMTRRSHLRAEMVRKPAFEAAKEARLAARQVAETTSLTLDQVNELRKITKVLRSMPEKKHASLLKHWSKKFKMSVDDLKTIMKTVAESETGAVMKGKTVPPWKMTRSEFASKAKGLPANVYDDIMYSAYERGMEIPDEILAPFKGRFSPRPPRPGPTPKGKEPLWAKGMDRVGEMSGGKYTLERQHTTQIPRGYVSMEEAMLDNWVRYAGPGTFEVNKLTPLTLRTMQNLIDIYPPKHGVVVDITAGGAHQGFSLPLYELERSKTLLNAVRRNYPKLLEKPKPVTEVPGTKTGMMHGQEVKIDVIPEGVGVSSKRVGKGVDIPKQRASKTTQEVIDLITGEEGAVGPKRTMLRKKGEHGGITIGGPSRSEIESGIAKATRRLGEALDDGDAVIADRLRSTLVRLRTRLESMGEPKYTTEQLTAMQVEKIERNKAAFKELIVERESFLKNLKKTLPEAEETATTTKSLEDARYARSIKDTIGRVEDDLVRIKYRGMKKE